MSCTVGIVLTAGVVLAAGGSYFIRPAEYWGGVQGLGVGEGFWLGLALKPLMVLVSWALRPEAGDRNTR